MDRWIITLKTTEETYKTSSLECHKKTYYRIVVVVKNFVNGSGKAAANFVSHTLFTQTIETQKKKTSECARGKVPMQNDNNGSIGCETDKNLFHGTFPTLSEDNSKSLKKLNENVFGRPIFVQTSTHSTLVPC